MQTDAHLTLAVATPLWRLHYGTHDAACEIVIRRSGYEGRFLFDGHLLSSHRFRHRDDAVAWASARETRYRLAGWSPDA
jgi:hypothetical protein